MASTGSAGRNTEQVLLEVVRNLRQHPETYRRVRSALKDAKSDEDRVRQLLSFATSDRELAALVPADTGADPQLVWTTVTVTTVLIPGEAY